MPPKTAMYKHVFPIGAWIAGATVDLPLKGGGTTLISPDNAAGTTALLDPKYVGYKSTGIENPFFYFSVPAVQEDTQFVSDKLDLAQTYHVVGPWGRYGVAGQSIAEQFYGAAPATWTAENAAVYANLIVPNYRDHTHLLGYNLEDDVSINAAITYQDAVVLMAQAFQDADTYGRPAFFVHLFPDEHNYWEDYDCKVAVSYMYPCGYRQDNSALDTEEGNFMSARIPPAVTASVNSSHKDWVDWLRYWMSYVPEGVHFWLILQTHDTTGTGTSGLRTPTDREFRKQFWIAVGEGVKGIFWFPGDNSSDIITKGLFDTTRASTMQVASELAHRLTPEIRKILLKCNRVTDQFACVGGGATFAAGRSYDSAYYSTLQHENGDLYVVVCNNNANVPSYNPSTITITSLTKIGRLVNLETGTEIRVNGSWSLPALDGTIFKYVADVGVPEWEPDHGINTVETWWSTHWANPSSVNYVADVGTHPTEIVVAAGDLEGYLTTHIANGCPPTTFRLQAGNHPYIVTTGVSHAHFIADDDLNRPVWYGHLAWGSSEAEWYNTFGALKGFSAKVGTDLDATALAAFNNPQQDLIYRNIDFRPAPGTLVEYKYFNRGGVWNTDHHTRNSALFFRNYKDVLVEGCTSQDFIQGTPDTDPTVTGSDTTYNSTGALPVWNTAHVAGNAGIQNIVVRDCDFVGRLNLSRGFPCAVFFDGGRGTVTHDIRSTGKYANGYQILMTNGDFTADADKKGHITLDNYRDAYCNVISAWNIDSHTYGQTNGFAITGRNNLIVNCDVNISGGALAFFAEFSAKAPLVALIAQQFYYESYFNVVDGCDITAGGVNRFVQHDPDLGILPSPNQSPTNPLRSKVGMTTVKNCHVKGTITTGWIADKSGATAATITPHTETNNTTG